MTFKIFLKEEYAGYPLPKYHELFKGYIAEYGTRSLGNATLSYGAFQVLSRILNIYIKDVVQLSNLVKIMNDNNVGTYQLVPDGDI